MELAGWKEFKLDSYDLKQYKLVVARKATYRDQRTRLVRHPETGVPINKSRGRLTFRDIAHASMSLTPGRQFMQLIRHLGITTCLELGTCGGISSMFLYSAILSNARKRLHRARYAGIEKCPARVQLTIASLQLVDDPRYGQFKIHDGTFEQGLPRMLRLFDHKLRFCYIDGHHLGAPTQVYFDEVARSMNSGIICIDDIDYNPGMARVGRTLAKHPRVQHVMAMRGKRFFVLTEKKHKKKSTRNKEKWA